MKTFRLFDRLHVLVAMSLCFVACVRVEADESQPELVSFAIERYGAPIILPLQLGDQRHDVILDSGATNHVFDSSLRPFLGAPVKTANVKGDGDSAVFQLFHPPQAFVGTLPLQSRKDIILADLSELRAAIGSNVRGIIGLEFFNDRIIRIDFDNGTVAVFRRGEGDFGPGVNLPLRRDTSGHVSVDVSIGSLSDVPMHIDTGYTGSISLPHHVFRYCVQRREIEVIGQKKGETLTGENGYTVGCLRTVQCGPYMHSQVPAIQSASGKLGLAYLARYNVTFDVTGGVLHLRPGKRFSDRDATNRSGLRLRVRDKVVVHEVEAKSPAAEHGIETGDVIQSVNGTPVSMQSLFAIRRILCGENGDQVVLQLRRNKTDFILKINLSPLKCQALNP